MLYVETSYEMFCDLLDLTCGVGAEKLSAHSRST